MGLDGIDPAAIGGGLSIVGAMIFIIRLAFTRLDKQDTAWVELLAAAERRAISAEETLAQLRDDVRANSLAAEDIQKESRNEIARLSEELRIAKLQIQELQERNGET